MVGCIKFSLFLCLIAVDEMPLYAGAPISCKESCAAINKFAVTNQLTESATQQLLHLISSHCPTPNSCPPTVYKLKKQIEQIGSLHHQYCSLCMELIPSQEQQCKNCVGRGAQMCYYSIMPFEEQLKDIFSGMCIHVTWVSASHLLYEFRIASY